MVNGPTPRMFIGNKTGVLHSMPLSGLSGVVPFTNNSKKPCLDSLDHHVGGLDPCNRGVPRPIRSSCTAAGVIIEVTWDLSGSETAVVLAGGTSVTPCSLRELTRSRLIFCKKATEPIKAPSNLPGVLVMRELGRRFLTIRERHSLYVRADTMKLHRYIAE